MYPQKHTLSKRIILGFWCLLAALYLPAQKYSNEFLSIGVGARAHALGSAVVASTSDVTGSFWNPAALARLNINNGIQIGAMHTEWFAGVGKFDYLGVAKPFDNGKRAIGLSVIRFGIDDIPNTLSLFEDDGSINFDNVTPFSAVDYGFMGSYAQYLFTHLGKLYLGGNVKVVHRTVGNFAKAWGFGLDAALQWHHDHWRFGVMAKDITNTFNSWTFDFRDTEKQVLEMTGNIIPESSLEVTRPTFTFGTSYHNQFKKIGIEAELDLIITTDGPRNTLVSGRYSSIDPAFGLELNYNRFIFLRGGVNNIQEELNMQNNPVWTIQPNLGVGLKLGKLRLDYAFSDVDGKEQNTYSHIISLSLDLDFGYLKKAIENSK